MKLSEMINEKKFKNDMMEYPLGSTTTDEILFVLDSCRKPIKETVKIEKPDAELLSDCILLKLQEMGQTERDHFSHLKDSFFEEKKRLLALHSRVCSLLDE